MSLLGFDQRPSLIDRRSSPMSMLIPGQAPTPRGNSFGEAGGNFRRRPWSLDDDRVHRGESESPSERQQKPVGILEKTVDLLSRGEYVTASIANDLVDGQLPALGKALKEFILPENRLTFHDVMKKVAPEFTEENPWTAGALSMAASIAFDPVTWVSFGSGKAIQLTAKAGGRIAHVERKLGNKFIGAFSEKYAKLKQVEGYEVIETAEQSLLNLLNPLKRPESHRGLLKVNAPETAKIGRPMADDLREQLAEHAVPGGALDPKDWLFVTRHEVMGNMVPFDRDAAASVIKRADLDSDGLSGIGRAVPEELEHLASVPDARVPVVMAVPRTRVGGRIPGTRGYAVGEVPVEDLRFLVPGAKKPVARIEARGLMDEQLKKFEVDIPPPEEMIRAFDESTDLAGIAKEVLDGMGLTVDDLRAASGMRFGGKLILGSETVGQILSAVKLDRVGLAVAELGGKMGLSALKRTFSRSSATKAALRSAGLGEEVIEEHFRELERLRSGIEANVLRTREEAVEAGVRLFGQVNPEYAAKGADASDMSKYILHDPERRHVMGEAVLEAERRVAELTEITKLSAPEKHQILGQVMAERGLTAEERTILGRWFEVAHSSRQLGAQAGMMKDLVANFVPVRFDGIRFMHRIRNFKKHLFGEADSSAKVFDSPGDEIRYASLEEARAAGREPITDALELYALRYIEASNEDTISYYNKALKMLFRKGDEPLDEVKIPKDVSRDFFQVIRPIGMPNWSEEAKAGVELYDRILNIFRLGATVARPAFLFRQAVGNQVQSFAASGGIPLFTDPGALGMAFNIVARGKLSHFEGLRTVNGGMIRREDLSKLLREFPVIQNMAIEDVGQVAAGSNLHKIIGQLDARNPTISHLTSQPKSKAAYEGFKKLMSKGLEYTNWPTYLEDISRLGLFMNRLALGDTAEQAYKVVTDGLFNYRTGLREFERKVLRRIVPFYSFNRFAVDLVGKMARQHPGRLKITALGTQQVAETLTAAFNSMQDALGGADGRDLEPLTDQERWALPGWLLEQPAAFAGLDEDRKAVFRLYNGFNFMDILGSVHTSDDGEFDAKATLMHGIASQLAPLLKVPLEVAIGQEFFTGRYIDPDGRPVGAVDEDKFLSAIGAQIGGAATGTVAGGGLGALLAQAPGVESVVKMLLRWEEAVDPQTGERKVYVNPYAWMVAQAAYPGLLDQASAVSREDRSPAERVLRIAGVGTARVDLLQAGTRKLAQIDKQVARKKRDLVEAMNERSESRAERAHRELQELLLLSAREHAFVAGGNLRGGQRWR